MNFRDCSTRLTIIFVGCRNVVIIPKVGRLERSPLILATCHVGSASCTVAIVTHDMHNVDVHKVNIGGHLIAEASSHLSEERKMRDRLT